MGCRTTDVEDQSGAAQMAYVGAEKMIYPQKWTGSVDKDIKTGVAEFTVLGNIYEINLESFADFQMISKMLDMAYLDGTRFVKDRAQRAVTRALSDIGC